MHPAEVLRRNIEGEDLWFIGPQGHVIYLPGGWWLQMSTCNTPYSDDDNFDANECYGYFARADDMQAAKLQWIDVRMLANHQVVSESQALAAHPGLDQYITKLNEGNQS